MTGVRALTSTQAYMAVFGALGVRSLGIVTPYPDDMNATIAECYLDEGITVTRHTASVSPRPPISPGFDPRSYWRPRGRSRKQA